MKKKKSVVVVVHIYKKKLDENERVSLIQLRKKLYKQYEICVITHEEVLKEVKQNPLFQGYNIKIFPKKFFTLQGYNKFMKLPDFYLSFKDFDYMLTYQTDCLVFKKSLDYWIKKKYDYVGAPWFVLGDKKNIKFLAVGNGGLSLRKIGTFIEVTKEASKTKNKIKIFLKNLIPSVPVLYHKLFVSRDYPAYHIGCRNEDIFYSYVAKQLVKDFKIANYKYSLAFSFEKHPAFCLKENKNELPFGCHAFQKYGKEFWMKFI